MKFGDVLDRLDRAGHRGVHGGGDERVGRAYLLAHLTLSPRLTRGLLGAPMCCESGIITSAGTGARLMALPEASSLL